MEALGEAALLLEGRGLRRELTVEEVAGQVEERESGVGGKLG